MNTDALAKALPDWMVEHPKAMTEDELRLVIATNIADRYARLVAGPRYYDHALSRREVAAIYDEGRLREAAQAYLDATDVTAHSWTSESEAERMTRIASARAVLQAVLWTDPKG